MIGEATRGLATATVNDASFEPQHTHPRKYNRREPNKDARWLAACFHQHIYFHIKQAHQGGLYVYSVNMFLMMISRDVFPSLPESSPGFPTASAR